MQAFRSLSHRPFALLWSGQTVSRLGDALYQLALAWWVLEKTGSATTMGMVLVFSFAPAILFAMIGGVIVDRLPRFRIMLVSDVVRGLIVALVAVLAYADQLEVWHVFAASLLFGIVDAFFQPAYTAAVPEIIDKAMLPSANSLTSLSQQVSGVAGPLMAAYLIGWGGTSTAFLLDAASFFVSAALLLPLLRMEAPVTPPPARHIGAEIRDGIGIVTGSTWIWLTILLASLGNITRGGPTYVALPFIIDQTLKADVNALGWVRAMVFIGAVIGALWVGRLEKISRRGWVSYGSMILAGGMTVWIGMAHSILELLIAGLVIGVCTAVFNLIWVTTLQEMVPQNRLGRVASIDYLGSLVFVPIGFAVTGWFTDLVNPPTVFVVGGVLTIVIWVVGLFSKSVRNLDESGAMVVKSLSSSFDIKTLPFRPGFIHRFGSRKLATSYTEPRTRDKQAKPAESSLLFPDKGGKVEINPSTGSGQAHTDPAPTSFQHLFEGQCALTPDAPAILFEGRKISYAELNHSANRLARRLQELGVGPETLVAISMERCPEMITAILGIFKAGGAYVPIDPALPDERKALILSETRAAVILTRNGHENRGGSTPPLPQTGATILNMDTGWQGALPANDTDLPTSAGADTLAYVIYTSGSTGRPKGALISHRGLVNLAQAQKTIFSTCPGDRVLQFSSLNFDASIFEIAMALCSGAALVLARREQILPGPDMLAFLRENAVTHLTIPPSSLANIPIGSLPALKTLIVAGETFPPELLARWGPGRAVFNAYGPTETTVWASTAHVGLDGVSIALGPQGNSTSQRKPPIGFAIPNAQVYLLDESLQPVPFGAPGEIFIGGLGVARGYLQRPDLTAERFIPNPFALPPIGELPDGGTGGGRLYRTGDIGRFLPDGSLEFIGRADSQIKLRGYRIEPGEIESALRAHPGVRDALVTVRAGSVDHQLTAYVIPNPDYRAPQALVETWQAEQAQAWQTLYEATYAKGEIALEDDFSGWVSSYTGQPIPESEMREWADVTAEQILALQPQRVLEIGCGSGLLVRRIAPHCKQYTGSDISATAIAALQRRLEHAAFSNVTLAIRSANDFSDIAPASYDAVVLNSVVQYFRDADYLLTVLDGAVRAVRPGGFIFIGDVRHLRLAEAFYTSVERRHSPHISAEQLRQRVNRRALAEEELLIDPAFFQALKAHNPAISHVDVELRRGRAHNELTCFRYNAILHIAREQNRIPFTSYTWGVDCRQLADLAALGLSPRHFGGSETASMDSPAFVVCGIPNARLRTGDLQTVDPHTLAEIAAENGFSVHLTWDAEPERFSAWFVRDASAHLPFDVDMVETPVDKAVQLNAPTPSAHAEVSAKAQGETHRPDAVTNHPLRLKVSTHLTASLRAYLQARLPDYMLPAAIVLLDRFPLNTSGKVDLAALPAPDVRHSAGFVAPRNRVEEQLAGIWSEVLGLEMIGIQDNFFELGGHSLLATQVISRIRNTTLNIQDIFTHPTIAELGGLLEIHHQESSRGGVTPPLLHASREGDLPLSFAQQRLWFLNQLAPNSPFYNIPVALRLKGQLDLTALQNSLDALMNRHEILRTIFPAENGLPRQVIQPAARIVIETEDISATPDAAPESAIRQIAARHARAPFDLARGPLLRVKLLRCAGDEHILLLTMHHIISDGWSMAVLASEIAGLYEKFAGNGAPTLPTLATIQYADFAVWQKNWLNPARMADQLVYWKKQLTGASDVLDLPTDYPRPATQAYHGAVRSIEIPAKKLEALNAFSRGENATLFMTLLAAFDVLLHRASGQSDFLVGTPIAGRNHVETEHLIGFFVNSLVLRADFARLEGGELTFRQLLGRVRQTALEAYAHQDLPFEKLVEELRPQRDLSRNALFQVMFVLQNAPISETERAGLLFTPQVIDNETAKFDLTLTLEETPIGLNASLEYNTDLFAPETAARMLGHYANLLDGILQAPDAPVGLLPMLGKDEINQLLRSNHTETHFASQSTIHAWVEEQARLRPQANAVTFEGAHLTYAELDGRANQLAHWLRAHGVGRETLVALLMERAPEMIVGLLGILKAGGAYLPIDPVYPPERVAFMLEDSCAPIMLSQEKMLASLPHITFTGQTLCLDTEWDNVAAQPASAPENINTPEDLAYVIYTSGSTGKPKGVMVTHYNVVRLFQATQDWYHFDQNDVWTMFHSCAFDFSVWEIWGALMYGGRVVIVPYLVSRSPETFYRLVEQEGVTVLNQTPSAFYQFIKAEETLGVSPNLKLRTVIFGGEALDLQALRPWFERHGEHSSGRVTLPDGVTPPLLVNMYGITETTVHVTYRPIYRKDLDTGAGSVIGTPIPDLQVYLLDANRQLCPLGVTGEIYVGGAGVARGYLNRPELSAERFIPNPFVTVDRGPKTEENHLLYKSGDLARRLPSGDLEYLGRADFQVKIRGFRVELGEIETTIMQFPGVQRAVVLAREDTTGDPLPVGSLPLAGSGKRLVAYIVPSGKDQIDTNALRNHLKESLPDYMLPTAFVQLESLPLTPNGKVDRRALQRKEAPGFQRPERQFVAPRTDVEQIIAAIWAKLLNVEKIGAQDDFFELGGHSLLAVQVISRVRDSLQVEAPLGTLFGSPTLEAFAAATIACETQAGKTEKVARALKQIESMSAQEVETMLTQKRKR